MRNKLLITLSIVVVLAIAGVVAFKTIWGGDAPEEVSLSTSEPVATGDFEFAGTWTVDNTTGEFDRANERYTRSYAGYRINEELASIGANEAVGRTDDVSGTMTIAETSITAVDVQVDMTTLESDQERRDGAIHDRGLETDRFPTASFTLTEPIAVGKEPKAGQKITADATGDFTLHGVTKRIAIPIEARWTGDKINVISSFDVSLPDYGIDAPTIPGKVLSVEDHGEVELQLNFVKSA
jgi:polyisoprenoid-binding protein YceI